MMAKIKLLIVDDEVNITKTIAATFAHWDYEVDTCHDGLTALAKIRETAWDIILLDLRLPGMDGLDVLKAMRAEKILTDVIIITAHGSIDNAIETMRYGATEFLQKPLDPDLLRTTVVKVLDRTGPESHQRTGIPPCQNDY
jgi:DNA-binding NtrC family response regulator